MNMKANFQRRNLKRKFKDYKHPSSKRTKSSRWQNNNQYNHGNNDNTSERKENIHNYVADPLSESLKLLDPSAKPTNHKGGTTKTPRFENLPKEILSCLFNSKMLKTEMLPLLAGFAPKCHGHQMQCKLLKVKKAGNNKNRCFFACSYPMDQSCKYFLWFEDHPQLLAYYHQLKQKQLQTYAMQPKLAAITGQALAEQQLQDAYRMKLLTMNKLELQKEIHWFNRRIAMLQTMAKAGNGSRRKKLSGGGKKEDLVDRLVEEASWWMAEHCAAMAAAAPADGNRQQQMQLPQIEQPREEEQEVQEEEEEEKMEEEGEKMIFLSDSEEDDESEDDDDDKEEAEEVDGHGDKNADENDFVEITKQPSAITTSSLLLSSKQHDGDEVVVNQHQQEMIRKTAAAAVDSHKEEHDDDDDDDNSLLELLDSSSSSEVEEEEFQPTGKVANKRSKRLQPAVLTAIVKKKMIVVDSSDEEEEEDDDENSEDDEEEGMGEDSCDDNDDEEDENEDEHKCKRSKKNNSCKKNKKSKVAVIKGSSTQILASCLPTCLSLMDRFQLAVQWYYGYPSIKPGQLQVLQLLLQPQLHQQEQQQQQPRRIIAIMPTGYGKSLCYTLPSLLHQHGQHGQQQGDASSSSLTIVISPLIALMQDQLQKLPPELPGVILSHTASSTSSNGGGVSSNIHEVCEQILSNQIRIVFVSPERLCSPAFQQLMHRYKTSSSNRRIGMVCIDEAHCISSWSFNFRPAYLRMRQVIHEILQPTAILALTATCSEDGRVMRDIQRVVLGPARRDGHQQQVEVIRIEDVRANLLLSAYSLDGTDDRDNDDKDDDGDKDNQTNEDNKKESKVAKLVKAASYPSSLSSGSHGSSNNGNGNSLATYGQHNSLQEEQRQQFIARLLAASASPNQQQPSTIIYTWRRMDAESLCQYLSCRSLMSSSGSGSSSYDHPAQGLDSQHRALLQGLQPQQGKVIGKLNSNLSKPFALATATTSANQLIPLKISKKANSNGDEQVLHCAVYHAGLRPDQRSQVMKRFCSNSTSSSSSASSSSSDSSRLSTVIATVAFGLGIDKADIRRILHYHLPTSLEGYLQEVGRGGRDGQPAQCMLLVHPMDFLTQHSLAYSGWISKLQVVAFVQWIYDATSEAAAAGGGGQDQANNKTKKVFLPYQELQTTLDISQAYAETLISILETIPTTEYCSPSSAVNVASIPRIRHLGSHYLTYCGQFRILADIATDDLLLANPKAAGTASAPVKPAVTNRFEHLRQQDALVNAIYQVNQLSVSYQAKDDDGNNKGKVAVEKEEEEEDGAQFTTFFPDQDQLTMMNQSKSSRAAASKGSSSHGSSSNIIQFQVSLADIHEQYLPWLEIDELIQKMYALQRQGVLYFTAKRDLAACIEVQQLPTCTTAVTSSSNGDVAELISIYLYEKVIVENIQMAARRMEAMWTVSKVLVRVTKERQHQQLQQTKAVVVVDEVSVHQFVMQMMKQVDGSSDSMSSNGNSSKADSKNKQHSNAYYEHLLQVSKQVKYPFNPLPAKVMSTMMTMGNHTTTTVKANGSSATVIDKSATMVSRALTSSSKHPAAIPIQQRSSQLHQPVLVAGISRLGHGQGHGQGRPAVSMLYQQEQKRQHQQQESEKMVAAVNKDDKSTLLSLTVQERILYRELSSTIQLISRDEELKKVLQRLASSITWQPDHHEDKKKQQRLYQDCLALYVTRVLHGLPSSFLLAGYWNGNSSSSSGEGGSCYADLWGRYKDVKFIELLKIVESIVSMDSSSSKKMRG